MRKLKIHKKFLHLILGFLIASTFYLYLEYSFEKKAVRAFTQSIYNNPNLNRYNEEEVILGAMQRTNLQMVHNKTNEMDLELNNLESFFTAPVLKYALTKEGACGGNSLVLAQILNEMGFKVRPIQMLVNGKYGGHIILEVWLNNKWAVLDPFYNLAFRNESGEIPSFTEVQNNWDYFKTQVPANYSPFYAYEGARYTNWGKVPVLGPVVKKMLDLCIGESKADQISLRVLFLNPKKILFYLSVFFLGFSFVSILNKRYFKIHLPRFKSRTILQKKVATAP